MGNIRKTYTKDEKLKAIKLYIEGGLSYQAVANTLNIPSAKSVRLWVKSYETEGESGLEEKRGKALGVVSGKGRPRKRTLTLEEENNRLRAENEYLKKWLGLDK